jgi:hypothetical protein
MLFARFDQIVSALLGTAAGGIDWIDEPIAEVATASSYRHRL